MTKLTLALGSLIVDNSHMEDVSVIVEKDEEKFRYRLMFLGPKKLSAHWFHARYVEHFCSILTPDKLTKWKRRKVEREEDRRYEHETFRDDY